MVTLIAAVAENGSIGKAGALPWHLPEDLKRFKALTTGHVILMGRKTWESIPEKFRPLPNRTNVVVTRRSNLALPDVVERFGSIDEAFAAHASEDIFVIGGAEIYTQTIDRADRLEITRVKQTFDGDAFFPAIDPRMWTESSRQDFDGYAFVTYNRTYAN
jgi:dihydrofolate reductase